MKKMEKDTVIFPLSPKLMKSEKKKLVIPLHPHTHRSFTVDHVVIVFDSIKSYLVFLVIYYNCLSCWLMASTVFLIVVKLLHRSNAMWFCMLLVLVAASVLFSPMCQDDI